MSRHLRVALATLTVLSAAAFASAASGARLAEPIDLGQVTARAEVEDSLFAEQPPKGPPSRIEEFVDSHGHRFRVGTDVAGLELAQYANVLASTVHRNETAKVLVEVVLPEQLTTICGPDALACYWADPVIRGNGWMYVPTVDPDLVHILVHEYGHHVDNQLTNLFHIDARCGMLGDGSRNWFIARNPRGFLCNASEWDKDVAELFAEDYVVLSGINDWVLRTIAPPTAAHLKQLAFDFANPFRPRRLGASGYVSRKRVLTKRFAVTHWTLLESVLRGPRNANFDLFLYRPGARKALAGSVRPGSREVIRGMIRPGKYELLVYAYRGSGSATLRIKLD
jgi:hypothetical protein